MHDHAGTLRLSGIAPLSTTPCNTVLQVEALVDGEEMLHTTLKVVRATSRSQFHVPRPDSSFLSMLGIARAN